MVVAAISWALFLAGDAAALDASVIFNILAAAALADAWDRIAALRFPAVEMHSEGQLVEALAKFVLRHPHDEAFLINASNLAVKLQPISQAAGYLCLLSYSTWWQDGCL